MVDTTASSNTPLSFLAQFVDVFSSTSSASSHCPKRNRSARFRQFVEALGGSLDLVARFPGLHVRIKLG